MATTQQLLDAVYDDPDADEPRVALAAHLTRRKDPRGEFITIQLAEAHGTATAAMTKRAAALLAKHAEAWLRPYGHIVHVTWARGFPVHANPVVFRGDRGRAWRTVR